MTRHLLNLVLALALLSPSSGWAVSKRQLCLNSCRQMIGACTSTCGAFGQTQKTCKTGVLKRCMREGVQACAVTTTTIPADATTTTMGVTTMGRRRHELGPVENRRDFRPDAGTFPRCPHQNVSR